MEFVVDLLTNLAQTHPIIVSVVALLGAISEILVYIPAVKANGVFQSITNVVSAVYSKIKPPVG
jgi:hypothetical protein